MFQPQLKYFPAAYLIFILLEIACILLAKRSYLFSWKDTLTNILTGVIGMVLTGALIKTAVLFVLSFSYNHSMLELPSTVSNILICICLMDFLYYWGHLFAHKINFAWGAHVVHHSSTYFNLSTGLRIGWTQHYLAIFYLPLALLGFHPKDLLVAYLFTSAYQFFQHSSLFQRIPQSIGLIFVTPLSHKLHHATNPEYLDKNLGGVLIVWDKIFGTYVKELPDVPPVFNTKNGQDNNLLKINFAYYIELWKNSKKIRGWRGRITHLLSAPGKENSRPI